MTGRVGSERIYQAQRAGIFRRLVDEDRLAELDAEQWLSQWEREAEANGPARGSQGYWDAASRWIAEQLLPRSNGASLEPAEGLSHRIAQGETRLAAGQRIERERRRRPRREQ
jgi:hypothetical protein